MKFKFNIGDIVEDHHTMEARTGMITSRKWTVHPGTGKPVVAAYKVHWFGAEDAFLALVESWAYDAGLRYHMSETRE
mgnify:CR=1 FL=1